MLLAEDGGVTVITGVGVSVITGVTVMTSVGQLTGVGPPPTGVGQPLTDVAVTLPNVTRAESGWLAEPSAPYATAWMVYSPGADGVHSV